jgi:methionyl-tRNA synthetase
MYVWFDALTNYISTLGWPEDTAGNYEKFWVGGDTVQYCGKDNTRQQSLTWQAMLLAAGLPPTGHIVVNGFINSGGQKMSKSLGNVINPANVIEEYKALAGDLSSDVLRYYLLRHVNSFEDSDMTMESLKEAYNANLANGLGNLASRILTLSEKYLSECPATPEETLPQEFSDLLEKFEIQKATDFIWSKVQALDKMIQESEPFKVIKVDEDKGKELISQQIVELYAITELLRPVMPKTFEILSGLIKANKKPEKSLFQRF